MFLGTPNFGVIRVNWDRGALIADVSGAKIQYIASQMLLTCSPCLYTPRVAMERDGSVDGSERGAGADGSVPALAELCCQAVAAQLLRLP